MFETDQQGQECEASHHRHQCLEKFDNCVAKTRQILELLIDLSSNRDKQPCLDDKSDPVDCDSRAICPDEEEKKSALVETWKSLDHAKKCRALSFLTPELCNLLLDIVPCNEMTCNFSLLVDLHELPYTLTEIFASRTSPVWTPGEFQDHYARYHNSRKTTGMLVRTAIIYFIGKTNCYFTLHARDTFPATILLNVFLGTDQWKEDFVNTSLLLACIHEHFPRDYKIREVVLTQSSTESTVKRLQEFCQYASLPCLARGLLACPDLKTEFGVSVAFMSKELRNMMAENYNNVLEFAKRHRENTEEQHRGAMPPPTLSLVLIVLHVVVQHSDLLIRRLPKDA